MRILFVSQTYYKYHEDVFRVFESFPGLDLALICPRNFPCSQLFKQAGHAYFPIRSHYQMGLGMRSLQSSLAGVCATFRPDVIIPLDDISAWLLRGRLLHRKSDGVVSILIKSLGDPTFYPVLESRFKFSQFARLVGVDVPRSLPTSQKGAKAVVKVFGLPCMIKESQSTGGTGVGLVKLSADVERYFLRFGHLYYWKRKIRRFLLRRAGALVAPANELYELQSVTPGDMAAYTAVAAAGQLLAGVAYGGRFARGAVPLETMHDVDISAGRAKLMENVAREIIKALQISGFVSFDFMTTEHSVVLIECNSRLMGSPFRNDGGLVAKMLVSKFLNHWESSPTCMGHRQFELPQCVDAPVLKNKPSERGASLSALPERVIRGSP